MLRRRGGRRIIGAVLAGATLLPLLAGCKVPIPSDPAVAAPTATAMATPPSAEELLGQEVDERLAAMSLRQELASLLMLHYPGTDPAALSDFMRRTAAGGFIVMGDNAPAGSDIAATTSSLDVDPSLPPIVAVDQEGGEVSRLDADSGLAAEQLRALPADASRAAFAARADIVRTAGIDLNFGIVADVTDDPDSFIYDRVLGTTPAASADRVGEAVLGEQGVVSSTLKHFPGHGLTDADSHRTVPSSAIGLDDWRSTAAIPFQRGIEDGAEVVMFGHLALTSIDPAPASLSSRWHEILRDELGFDGVTITDDMLMLQQTELPEYQDPVQNAVRALQAGNTMLLYVLAADPAVSGVDVDALLDGLEAAVEDGRISRARWTRMRDCCWPCG